MNCSSIGSFANLSDYETQNVNGGFIVTGILAVVAVTAKVTAATAKTKAVVTVASGVGNLATKGAGAAAAIDTYRYLQRNF